MTALAQSMEVYLVPRNGTIESVTLTDHADLRRFRTELEILRRIARKVASMRLTPPRQDAENADLRNELFNALKDASNPVVEEAVAMMDLHNPDLRKELFMSVINEEAENIVQEAVENGIATPAAAPMGETPPVVATAPAPQGSTDKTQSADSDPTIDADPTVGAKPPEDASPPADANQDTPVEEALAQAQEELAKAVESARTDQLPTQTAKTDEAVEGATDTAKTQEETTDDDSAGSIESQLDACLDAELGRSATDEVSTPDAHRAPDVPFARPAAKTSSDASVFAEYTADKATAAVEEIERGIRKLADLLSNDVNTQWKQAQDAFVEVMDARAKAGTLHQEATQMTRGIARLKEEIEIARDDADIARREAKLMREDALRAKQRAEDFADAAKQCTGEM